MDQFPNKRTLDRIPGGMMIVASLCCPGMGDAVVALAGILIHAIDAA